MESEGFEPPKSGLLVPSVVTRSSLVEGGRVITWFPTYRIVTTRYIIQSLITVFIGNRLPYLCDVVFSETSLKDRSGQSETKNNILVSTQNDLFDFLFLTEV